MASVKSALLSTPVEVTDRPTQAEAEEAVRTLLRWAGDNPSREGLLGWLVPFLA